MGLRLFLLACFAALNCLGQEVQFVAVDANVRLEVLDWGGSGRPLILLAGLGNTAHVFDQFARKLIASYHVYGITRRGYGSSSAPPSGYSADRLGDDVLAVMKSLKLMRPVLVGHSIGGEELSSVGSRFPETVAGLIYLDVDNSYAYYDRSRGDLNIDLQDLQRKLVQLQSGKGPADRPLVQELLQDTLPQFERTLRELQKNPQIQQPRPPASPAPTPADEASFQAWQAWQKKTFGYEMPEGELRQLHRVSPEGHVGDLTTDPAINLAIIAGEQRYTSVGAPVLALFALPHDPGPYSRSNPAARAAFESEDLASTGALANAFETGLPSAHVVRLPNAGHYLFLTNEADVLREMKAFISGLP
jgi:non-heme chloroperoxidase